jgi:predicted phosphohydrolase
MAIYGISDLHLSLNEYFDYSKDNYSCYKPMSVFGEHWSDHVKKIFCNWNSVVDEDDTVLVPGDLSWAMHLNEALYDFDFLAKLKGKIIICRGNHDYWWDTKAKIVNALPANVMPLQNESIIVEDVVISATRGWICPGSKDFHTDDQKIYRREMIRLEMALQHGKKLIKQADKDCEHWVMLHYRPTNDDFEKSGFIDLMQQYGIKRCFYGHLHGKPFYNVLNEKLFDIDFKLLSCDYLNFQPLRLK